MRGMSEGAYQPKPFEIAGVDLFGERQDDGSVLLGSAPGIGPDQRTALPNFPESIEVAGAVYTLEFVRRNKDEALAAADPSHPGHRVEWGVYV